MEDYKFLSINKTLGSKSTIKVEKIRKEKYQNRGELQDQATEKNNAWN